MSHNQLGNFQNESNLETNSLPLDPMLARAFPARAVFCASNILETKLATLTENPMFAQVAHSSGPSCERDLKMFPKILGIIPTIFTCLKFLPISPQSLPLIIFNFYIKSALPLPSPKLFSYTITQVHISHNLRSPTSSNMKCTNPILLLWSSLT